MAWIRPLAIAAAVTEGNVASAARRPREGQRVRDRRDLEGWRHGRLEDRSRTGRQRHQAPSETPADQSVAEPLPRPRQPRQNRAPGAPDAQGRLLGAEALEIAEHDRIPVSLREATNLLVEGRPRLGRSGVALVRHRAKGGTPPLVGAPPRGVGLDTNGDPEGNAMKPARDGIGLADRRGPAGEDEERGLKGVLGVVRIAKDLLADAQHHRCVPFHQRREGRLIGPVLAVNEPLDELGVGQVAHDPELEDGVESMQHSGTR